MNPSQIILESFHSRALEGNPLNDPVVRRVPVYLPPDYDESTRYPTVYLLAAFAARGLKLLNDDLWEENIQERLDRLIGSGEVRPMIVVMPDASTRYGGSQYLNSTATGNYEDHILELVNFIDAKYPTLTDRDSRAVMGHSSGGYGALRMAMRRPDVFGLVAAHASDQYFEMVYQKDFPHFLRFYQKAGEEGFANLLADPGTALSKGASFYALAVAAMASCYSPNPKSPWGFDLPVDLYTGELIPEVWQRWLDHDPIRMVFDHSVFDHSITNHADALRSMNLLYLDCGIFDEENLLYGARIFARNLKSLDIPHTYQEFEGGHRNTRFRYDTSLKLISSSIKAV